MSLKVLIVDDDDVIVFLHKMEVEENGLSSEPLSFENGKDALDYLTSEIGGDQVFLIFLDINMPVMNGWQLLDSIQSAAFAKKVFVAMVTSSVNYQDHDKANLYPQVIGYFEKPLNAQVVRKVMQYPELASYLLI